LRPGKALEVGWLRKGELNRIDMPLARLMRIIEGEVGVILINLSNEAFTIENGDELPSVIAKHEGQVERG